MGSYNKIHAGAFCASTYEDLIILGTSKLELIGGGMTQNFETVASTRKLAAGKQVFTTGEAARLCNLSQQTIIRCFDDGRLRGFRVPGSRARRIPREDLIRFMRAHNMPLDSLGMNAITLLVMDHESDTLELIRETADTIGGIELHIAKTAYEAGVLTAKVEPHVTILNARLPDIDIVSACRTLRKANGLPSSEVIVVATKFRQGELEELKEANVRFFLRKPIVKQELTRMIQLATAS